MYHNTNYELCKRVSRIKLNLMAFGHASVNSEWNGTVLSPVYSRLYYISGGKSSITPKDSNKINLEVGKWYLIPTGCSFEYDCIKEMEHFYFHLKLSDFDGTDLLRKCGKPLYIDAKSDKSNFMKDCIDNTNILDGLSLQKIAFDVILDILKKYNVSIKTENYSPCVMKALSYIKENLSVRLTVSGIADSIYVSKSTLTKHFHKELSMSVNEYIYDLVMSGAEHMLTTGDESVHTISEKYGFYDQFYFSRRFKEKFGQSPSEYRKCNPL